MWIAIRPLIVTVWLGTKTVKNPRYLRSAFFRFNANSCFLTQIRTGPRAHEMAAAKT